MKNYTRRNFLEMLKYVFFSHAVCFIMHIVLFSEGERQYTEKGLTDSFNTILFMVAFVAFAVSSFAILQAHFKNSEKKMNYLNATYEGGNEHEVAAKTALKEAATMSLANLAFQIPMIVIFTKVGYRYANASVFETLYVCDVGVYILCKSAILGALLIALAYFAVYFLGVFLVISPMWNMARIRKQGAPIKPEEAPKDFFHRHTFKSEYKIFYVFRKLILSLLISFGIIFVMSVIIDAFANEFGAKIAYIMFGIIYLLVFYKVHGYRRDSSYFPHKKKFDFAKEAVSFFNAELKYYIIIFAVLAVLCEISIFAMGANNIPLIFFRTLFPFYGIVKVPVLRSVVNLLWALAVVLFCAVFKSYRRHRRVDRASKYRRK